MDNNLKKEIKKGTTVINKNKQILKEVMDKHQV